MGTSFILLCVRCATPASSEWGACERCGSLLRFEYRQDAPVSQFTSGRLGEGEGIWRYGSVLPQERGITHGEGSTPLTELKALSMETASRRLFVKDEGRNPTGSLHDRGSASVVSAAKQAGATALAMTSNGSAGVSLAAYARRAGLEAQITLSRFVSANDVHECRSFGAAVSITQVGAEENAARSRGGGLYAVFPGREPFRVEGLKTLGFEIAEQLEWSWPSVIVYPCATGLGLTALWKAIVELEQHGLVSGPRPRLVGVQPEGCAPLVRAFDEGRGDAEHWGTPRCLSREFRTQKPPAAWPALAAVRASNGRMVAVSDTEVLDAVTLCARHEGVMLGLEGGACLAAARRLLGSAELTRNDSVVLVNTLSALRSNAWAGRFASAPASEQDKLGGLITPR